MNNEIEVLSEASALIDQAESKVWQFLTSQLWKRAACTVEPPELQMAREALDNLVDARSNLRRAIAPNREIGGEIKMPFGDMPNFPSIRKEG